jgi:hypothetical protein
MSALIVSAAAWVPSQPQLVPPVKPPGVLAWVIHAEVSVTTSDGKPVGDLPKSAFKTHVMFADGMVHHPGFTVTDGSAGWNAPGFYFLKFVPASYSAPIRPTAFGVAIARRDAQGQVVAPIVLAWKSEVEF